MTSFFHVYDHEYCESSSSFVKGDTIDNVKACTHRDIVNPYEVKTYTEVYVLKRDLGKLEKALSSLQKKIDEKQARLDEIKHKDRELKLYEIYGAFIGRQLIACDSKEAAYQCTRNPVVDDLDETIVRELTDIPCYTREFIENKKREEAKAEIQHLQRRIEELKKLE